MFAARFDPTAMVQEKKESVVPQKRKAEEVVDVETDDSDSEANESEDSSNDSSSGSDSESSDSASASASASDSDSDSDSSTTSEDNNNDKDSDVEMEDAPQEPQEPQEHNPKFSSIISRFNQSIQQAPQIDTPEEEQVEEVETHDIAPLPQPSLPRDHKLSASDRSTNLNWLASPLYIKTDETCPFSDFALSTKLLKNLETMGFTTAFASQIKTLELLIPEINNSLNPGSIKGDVLVNASTGSGKTLAYCLPVIQSLEKRLVARLRCIVLVPTRPLINQVYKTLVDVSRGIDLNIVTMGKSDMSLLEESAKLRANTPDIVVSTPGRLVDHLNMGSISLSDLQWCVIDEADRLLNQSFQDWSNVLISKLNEVDDGMDMSMSYKPSLTKMIFSATLTTDAGKLSALQFRTPRLIIVNNEESILQNDKMFTLPTTLKEHFVKFTSSFSSYKPLLLLKLLKGFASGHTLVFTKSNEATVRLSTVLSHLTRELTPEITVGNINSQLNASTRSKTLKEFSEGKISVLVATDLIARGLDQSTIQNVVNYDLPPSGREYVHRVGRTARAGQDGAAFTLVIGRGEGQFFERISRDINRSSPVETIELDEVVDGDKEVYQRALGELEKMIHKR